MSVRNHRRWLGMGALLLTLSFVTACGNGDEISSSQEIVIPYGAVEALETYSFTSHLELTAPQGDLDVTFDGVYQAPDRYQGTWTSSGSFRISPVGAAEVIAIGQQVWWREPRGVWQAGVKPGGDSVDPFLGFLANASPAFFVRGLTFDSLRLHTNGPPTAVNGVEAYPVRFDKAALIGALDQGSFTKEGDKDPAIVREDALAFLPDDATVEAWLAVDDLHPVRIVVSMSAAADDPHADDFILGKPFDVRLEMDIADPNADVNIQPPDLGG